MLGFSLFGGDCPAVDHLLEAPVPVLRGWPGGRRRGGAGLQLHCEAGRCSDGALIQNVAGEAAGAGGLLSQAGRGSQCGGAGCLLLGAA